jgi:hypothetical protein
MNDRLNFNPKPKHLLVYVPTIFFLFFCLQLCVAYILIRSNKVDEYLKLFNFILDNIID